MSKITEIRCPAENPFGALFQSRREALQRMGMGFGALAAQMLTTPSQAFSAADPYNPMLPKEPHFPVKAKHVIHIFANGGPSHVDLFDPKPALEKYAGQTMPGETPRTERPTGETDAIAF